MNKILDKSHELYTKLFLQLFKIFNKQMKPQRPDSAKSAKTRITIDSQFSSNNLNNSKFSQTYSQGVKANHDKNNDFHKYVSEKNKDPKFKKFLETNLPQIPEQLKPSTQLSKLTSKPFERKTSKIDKEKSEKKVEQVQKKIQQQPKPIKKQNLQSSKTFMDKSKQKMKLASKPEMDDVQTNSKIEQKNPNIQNEHKQNSNGNKPKINLNGFILNIPGKAPQVIKQEKKQQQKIEENEETKKRKQREKIMTQISEFVTEVEERNVDYLPERYDQFIDRNMENRDFDMQKININDFLEEPNEKDYTNLVRKINENERKLQNNDKKSKTIKNNSSLSINLEQIIDDSSNKKQQEQDKQDDSILMSSMSASDVKDRNMFLTQILKGRRLTEDQLCQIKQNNDAMVKLIKLEDNNKEDYLDDDQVEITQINMSKKKTYRIMERNKIEAAGDYYRECDYLTPEQQKRIDDIINGAVIESPFEFSEMQTFTNRRIDEGIKIHRKLCKDLEGTQLQEEDVRIEEETLPKDPILRKKAELKILREKISSVNARLSSLNEVVVNKTKLQNLMTKYKQNIKPSKMSESIIMQKNRQIEGQCEQLRQAEEILTKVEQQKQQILQILDDLTKQYSKMYNQAIRIQNMDADQLRKVEQDKLNRKKKQIQNVQNQATQFEKELDTILQAGEELKKKLEVLDKIMTVKIQIPKCQGYEQGQTIEDLDELVTKKWQAAEEAVQTMRNNVS